MIWGGRSVATGARSHHRYSGPIPLPSHLTTSSVGITGDIGEWGGTSKGAAEDVGSAIEANRQKTQGTLTQFNELHVNDILTATKIVATTIVGASDARLKDVEVRVHGVVVRRDSIEYQLSRHLNHLAHTTHIHAYTTRRPSATDSWRSSKS